MAPLLRHWPCKLDIADDDDDDDDDDDGDDDDDDGDFGTKYRSLASRLHDFDVVFIVVKRSVRDICKYIGIGLSWVAS